MARGSLGRVGCTSNLQQGIVGGIVEQVMDRSTLKDIQTGTFEDVVVDLEQREGKGTKVAKRVGPLQKGREQFWLLPREWGRVKVNIDCQVRHSDLPFG